MKNISISPKILFKLFSIIYILGGLSATILSIIFNFNKEYVGIAFLAGALVALLLNKKYDYLEFNKEDYKIESNRLFKTSIIMYFFLCIVLLYIFVNSLEQYYLPLEFFLIIFLISAIILAQILLKKKLCNLNEKFILFEILFLNIVVFSSFIFLFPGPYGNDAPFHVGFIKNVANTGFLIGESHYQNYPIFHLLFINIIKLCKIENFKFIQFILLFVQNIILLLFFAFTKKLFNNKIALISIMLLSLAPYFSQVKYYYFPSVFVTLFFILALYSIFNFKDNSIKYSLMIMLSYLAIIFSHPMVPLILITALIIILFLSKFGFKNKKITFTSILFILITTISLWMKPGDIKADNLLTYSILSIRNAIESADYTAVTRATLAPLISKWEIILSDLGFILLIFLAIIGSLYILGNYATNLSKYTKYKLNLIKLSIITLIFIPIPYILTMIYPQSLPARWFPYIEIFASLFAGFSIYIIFNNLSKSKYKYILILLTSVLIFFLVSNPVINPNSQLYVSEISTRSGLTSSEIDASNFINQYSDIKTIKGNSKFIAFVNINSTHENYIDPDEGFMSGLNVIRDYDIEKGFTIPLFGAKGKLLDFIYPGEEFFELMDMSNKVYNNGNLTMYYR